MAEPGYKDMNMALVYPRLKEVDKVVLHSPPTQSMRTVTACVLTPFLGRRRLMAPEFKNMNLVPVMLVRKRWGWTEVDSMGGVGGLVE